MHNALAWEVLKGKVEVGLKKPWVRTIKQEAGAGDECWEYLESWRSIECGGVCLLKAAL